MGWFFRKSKNFGLFTINLSKSGLSLSTGVTGARINAGKRGVYVSFGKNGIYYKKKLFSKNSTLSNSDEINNNEFSYDSYNSHTIKTEDVKAISDNDSIDLISELNYKIAVRSWFYPVLWLIIFFLMFYIFKNLHKDIIPALFENKQITYITVKDIELNVRYLPSRKSNIIGTLKPDSLYLMINENDPLWYKIYYDSTEAFVNKNFANILQREEPVLVTPEKIKSSNFELNKSKFWKSIALMCTIAIIILIIVANLDYKRKLLILEYSLDEFTQQLHTQFVSSFSQILDSKKVWQILHSSKVSNYKYSAGANSEIIRKPIKKLSLNEYPISSLTTNINIPHIGFSDCDYYFFPERLVIKRGKEFGGLLYKNLKIISGTVNFIESETVPEDASIISQTWKYLNKDGSPDKRFQDNIELPVCKYSSYEFSSVNGINEILYTSKVDAFNDFFYF
ncbi:MAG: DUF4236 domain-containing protein [Saprospiraceae bacterium]|nr:DUF4236 domain-containing protein [Saprospiraceae bacterium]